MKKHNKKIIGILWVFLIISCTLESKFSLPNDEKIKTELLGEWLNEKDSTELLRIEKKDANTYTLIFVEQEKIDQLTAYSKTINGYNIMNVIIEQEGTVTNIFYGFTVDDNTLTYSEVNNTMRKDDFASETELLLYLQENVSKKDFFINPVSLQRK